MIDRVDEAGRRPLPGATAPGRRPVRPWRRAASGWRPRAWPISALGWALILAAAVRLVLLPITYGHDFVVWDDATRLLLRGVNPYTHWRQMPNAYPYLPVFLYILLPFQWLAQHTPLTFTVLGKVPLVAADLAIGATLYHWLVRAGRPTRIAVAAACLYLFNPLVLYNSAFLGRFDAVALAFLLPALSARGTAFAVLYGLAVATKTFPIFILPALLVGRYRRTPRELLGAAGVVVATALPFLLWDPVGLANNLTVRLTANSIPLPRGLSWQYALQDVLPQLYRPHVATVTFGLMAAAFIVAILCWRDRPPLTLCAFTFSAFLLVDRKIWEQYLTWPLPFLIALGLLRRDLKPLLLAGGLTLAAVFMNELRNPVDPRFILQLVPYPPLKVNLALALGIVLYIALDSWRSRPAGDRAEQRAVRAVP